MTLRRRIAGFLSRPFAPRAQADPVGATYAPEVDGEPDPGEVVWAWVPYEDDPRQGKDRPVLILAAEGDGWTGLMLSSQDHDRDAADEARHGRHWMDVGSGGWDRQGRPSEVRLDRLLRLRRDDVRREGAALDERVFAAVVAAVRGLDR
ncbi:PemK-like, MazF-like toxin of type II toxin-antitoxin system [Nocardioides alpinus]|uniref:Growth inhibitor PemK n=1 Tax=Nocardioides alpinus TaxID=748909 RepID=A0A1I0VVM4_9ACTN|nr:type II toxin-antitoxin system PemK/MazF family toxin [Nocardioides alpinus]PKH37495.1 growth inhibitor PemK [Nocardioides alpinus]SFA80097.1 PemK-like, MazF-like toxin of type II toxin-antitoxin system [Nocardioides alpinus]